MREHVQLRGKWLRELVQLHEDRWQILEDRIAEMRTGNAETKSSMGDKYETGREMLQQEVTILLRQQKVLQEAIKNLHQVPVQPSKVQHITSTNFIKAEGGYYFIGPVSGKYVVDEVTLQCLTPASPLGRQLMGKSVGDQVTILDKEVYIQEIF